MTAAAGAAWLTAGPGGGAESLADHVRRLGPCPQGGEPVREAVAESGLRGRGGARFPTSVKWEAVAARGRGRAVVVVNGAEGEPASWKDQLLLAHRPHLVLDGAVLAARSVGAHEVVVYVGAGFHAAEAAIAAALRERAGSDRGVRARLASAPARYVAGEETAAVAFLNGGDAKPTVVPPRPFERGVGGRPTLVQNVETLASVALVARFGARWYREAGTPDSPGTTLLTLRGAVSCPGVLEVAHGTSLAEAVDRAGGSAERAVGVLLGGYFGTWLPGRLAASLRLDDRSLAGARASLGCGVVAVLPEATCGVAETSRVFGYLARESAQQCGPCRVGLPALAGVLAEVAAGRATPEHAERLRRWTAQLGGGRGACRHPDGAVGFLRSAMDVFVEDFENHLRLRPCRRAHREPALPVPRPGLGWR